MANGRTLTIRVITLLVMLFLLYGCGARDEAGLQAELDFGSGVSWQIDTLFEEQQSALEDAAGGFFALRTDAGAQRELVLYRDPDSGGYLWYDETDYQQQELSLPEELADLADLLFDSYDVRRIVVTDASIRFEIAEDGLVYAPDPVEAPQDHVFPLEGNWYHTWFEYGI